MINSPFFGTFFLSLSLIGLFHGMAVFFNLYWEIWWFDILMHFLGGFWVAIATLWFLYFSPFNKKFNFTFLFSHILFLGILGTIIVGLGWEVFEYITDSTYTIDYISDTISDLIMDVFGAIIASLYVNFFGIKIKRVLS